jgi:hypothetical protein
MGKEVTLWTVHCGRLESVAAIETAKQYRLPNRPMCFGCNAVIDKDDPRVFATPVEAKANYVALREGGLRAAERSLEAARAIELPEVPA